MGKLLMDCLPLSVSVSAGWDHEALFNATLYHASYRTPAPLYRWVRIGRTGDPQMKKEKRDIFSLFSIPLRGHVAH